MELGKYILPDSIATDMQSPIKYSADHIKYRLKSEESDFKGKAQIEQDKTKLNAGFINIDWQTNMLQCTLMLKRVIQQNKPNPPVIKEEGRDPMTGDEMTYNLKTKRGKIKQGATKADDGLHGNQIRNQSNKVFIKNSTYTTCDLDTAHFHFESEKNENNSK